MIEYSIPNLARIERAFRQSPVLAKKYFGRALKAAALEVLKRRSTEVPVKTGQLRASFQMEVGADTARVYPTKKYAIYVHGGTRPHIIRARNKKVLADKREGRIFGRIVRHPGTRANPFMQRMLDKSRSDINAHFATALDLIRSDIETAA